MARLINNINFKIQEITPEIAKNWLSRAPQNRCNNTLREQRLASWYAKMMKNGKWLINGEAIVFSESGFLLNGIIRLRSCVEANMSFRSLVIHGVNDNSYATINSQKTRKITDILTIMRYNHAQTLASCVKLILNLSEGVWNGNLSKHLDDETLLTIIVSNNKLVESVAFAHQFLPHERIVHPMYFAAMHYILSLVDKNKAESFLNRVCGDDAKFGEPEKALRDQLSSKVGVGQAAQKILLLRFIKAWNAKQCSEEIKLLTVKSTEEFPIINGWHDDIAVFNGEIVTNEDDEFVYNSDDHLYKSDNWNEEDIIVEREIITPEKAQEYINSNHRNRKMAEHIVLGYMSDMSNLKWNLNGETIKIADNGLLLDGQHRLYACVRAKVPFETVVVKNLHPRVFHTFDRGNRRGFSDTLNYLGYQNTHHLGSAIRRLWYWKETRMATSLKQPSNHDMLAIMDYFGAETFHHVPYANEIHRTTRIPKSLSSMLVVLIQHHDKKKRKHTNVSDAFFNNIIFGNHNQQDSSWMLREHLMTAKTRGVLNYKEIRSIVASTIKAWNAFENNETIRSLRFRANKAIPEFKV